MREDNMTHHVTYIKEKYIDLIKNMAKKLKVKIEINKVEDPEEIKHIGGQLYEIRSDTLRGAMDLFDCLANSMSLYEKLEETK